VTDVARAHRLAAHLDGARLMNAVVATDIPAAEYAASFDSAWIDMTKGLGAPVGAVLAGSAEFIEEAWRFKQQMGGAMRQAGIIAAGGVYALTHHVERLADDHARARRLAEALDELPAVEIDLAAVETNLIYFDVRPPHTGPDVRAAMLERGVRLSGLGEQTVRAVTHLGVDDAGIELAIKAFREVLT
jgi:threonine aldolase